MVKRIALLACLLTFIPANGAAAQTPIAIEGLQVIAERQYASETEQAIDTSGDGVFLVSARVYLFDEADNAESTWDTLVAAESVEKDLPKDDASFSYEKTELKDVGDRAMILSINAELTEGTTGTFRTVIAQRDEMIVTVTAIAGSAEAAEIADTLVAEMIERDPAQSESTYDGLGASSGGVWDVFLPDDADELQGLQAYADKETRPATN